MANISDFAAIYDCTVWEYDGEDFYGNASYKPPVLLVGAIYYSATSETFINNNGKEQTAKYEIICPVRTSVTPVAADSMKPLNYIAFGDQTQFIRPNMVKSHEIASAELVKVPFSGLEDEVFVMV